MRYKMITSVQQFKSLIPSLISNGKRYAAGSTVEVLPNPINNSDFYTISSNTVSTNYGYSADGVYFMISRVIKDKDGERAVEYAKKIESLNGKVEDIVNASQQAVTNTQGALTGLETAAGNSTTLIDKTDFVESLENNFMEWNELQPTNTQFMDMKSTIGIFGLPYQYMPHVDPRINSTAGDEQGKQYNLGSVYAENIISGMPLLLITPGKPAFMAGYKREEQKTVIQKMVSLASGNIVGGLEDLVGNNERFYTFDYDLTGYYSVVNPMCRITARFMNIADKTINGTKLDALNWMTLTGQKVQNFLSFNNDLMAIPFYIDSETQVSDSFSNSLSDISLASTVDQFSDMAKELMFYMGFVPSVVGFDSAVKADLLSNQENFSNFVEGLNLGGSIFGSLGKQITSVATGGKLIFPKIWGGSEFSRSYNVNIKLRSPDLDNFSLWINIIVPLCHILGLVVPRMVENNPNAYTTPPLIRAMYKGFFNVDMGMITSADISKGDDAQWSAEGIPTSVDVSLTITDLYDAMSLTATKATNFAFDTVDNTAEMDYLMNLCGINIYKPEIGRLLDIYLTNKFGNKLPDIVTNLWGSIKQNLSQSINNIFRGFR